MRRVRRAWEEREEEEPPNLTLRVDVSEWWQRAKQIMDKYNNNYNNEKCNKKVYVCKIK